MASMNFEQARFNMVEQQIRTWDVLDQDVLDLLYAVPREEFVPPAYRSLAFTDMEIPIGEAAGSTRKPNFSACAGLPFCPRERFTGRSSGTNCV